MQKKSYLLIGVLLMAVALAVIVKSRQKDPVADQTHLNIDLSQFENHKNIFITPAQLQEKLGDENLVILDASHPKGYAKGHIPGAISIGFKGLSDTTGKPGDKEWGTILPKAQLEKKLESFGVDNTTLVVAYSDIFKGPGAGGRAVWQLKMAGFDNARLLYGGLSLWKKSGYALSDEPPVPVPATGLSLKEYDESYRTSQADIHEHLESVKLVDVRSLKEFTGQDTSRGEARGGHIKGAKWLEWTALLNKDAGVKSPEQIKALMAGVGIRPEDDFVVY